MTWAQILLVYSSVLVFAVVLIILSRGPRRDDN